MKVYRKAVSLVRPFRGRVAQGHGDLGSSYLFCFLKYTFIYIYIYTAYIYIYIYVCLFACITQYTPFASTKLGKILVATTENLPSKWH